MFPNPSYNFQFLNHYSVSHISDITDNIETVTGQSNNIMSLECFTFDISYY